MEVGSYTARPWLQAWALLAVLALPTGGLDVSEIAFFTQRDAYGDAGFVSALAALRRHGLRDGQRVLHVQYERNTLAVENALADILLSEPLPRAVIMVGAYAPCARFIQLAHHSRRWRSRTLGLVRPAGRTAQGSRALNPRRVRGSAIVLVRLLVLLGLVAGVMAPCSRSTTSCSGTRTGAASRWSTPARRSATNVGPSRARC